MLTPRTLTKTQILTFFGPLEVQHIGWLNNLKKDQPTRLCDKGGRLVDIFNLSI